VRDKSVNTTLLSVFAGVSLLLALIGVYGVMSYTVAQHTREIGIRMALGAQRGMVLRLIMREGSVMLLCGLALGLLLAAATGKILSGILFEVGAFDPPAFASAFVVLAAATLLATWLPARHATRINPMVALRTE
jgi:putative ABC transport system permease protein